MNRFLLWKIPEFFQQYQANFRCLDPWHYPCITNFIKSYHVRRLVSAAWRKLYVKFDIIILGSLVNSSRIEAMNIAE